MIRAVVAMFAVGCSYAGILATTASVRPDNALVVDIQVTTEGSVNTFMLQGRMTVPLVILPLLIAPPGQGIAAFRGYVALDLHSSDAPQIVWYYSNAPVGRDDPPVESRGRHRRGRMELVVRDPQTFTLVEADRDPEAGAVGVLDMQIQGNFPVYRALPVETLFGEAPGRD